MNSVFVHCLRTHKFHFSTIFSLKLGSTALFTHLKIILLQCFRFSVFSFSKISSIQTDIFCRLVDLVENHPPHFLSLPFFLLNQTNKNTYFPPFFFTVFYLSLSPICQTWGPGKGIDAISLNIW